MQVVRVILLSSINSYVFFIIIQVGRLVPLNGNTGSGKNFGWLVSMCKILTLCFYLLNVSVVIFLSYFYLFNSKNNIAPFCRARMNRRTRRTFVSQNAQDVKAVMKISKKLKMPQSTVYEILKRFLTNQEVEYHVQLVPQTISKSSAKESDATYEDQ